MLLVSQIESINGDTLKTPGDSAQRQLPKAGNQLLLY